MGRGEKGPHPGDRRSLSVPGGRKLTALARWHCSADFSGAAHTVHQPVDNVRAASFSRSGRASVITMEPVARAAVPGDGVGVGEGGGQRLPRAAPGAVLPTSFPEYSEVDEVGVPASFLEGLQVFGPPTLTSPPKTILFSGWGWGGGGSGGGYLVLGSHSGLLQRQNSTSRLLGAQSYQRFSLVGKDIALHT